MPEIIKDKLILTISSYIHLLSPLFSTWQQKETKFSILQQPMRKYNLLYYRDILQQERSLTPRLCQGKQNLIKKCKHLTDVQICNAINQLFIFCESVFEQYQIKFCIVWPRTAIETVLAFNAEHNMVSVTFPYVSKGEGNLIYWANGSFATGEQHVALYNSDEIFSSRDDAPILAPTDRAGASKRAQCTQRRSPLSTFLNIETNFSSYLPFLNNANSGFAVIEMV